MLILCLVKEWNRFLVHLTLMSYWGELRMWVSGRCTMLIAGCININSRPLNTSHGYLG